jgi:hypothetical protein
MTNYLDYYKTILNKVSFDAYLFHKEYRKAMRDLNAQEMSDLNEWIQSTGFHNILAEQMNGQLMHHNRMWQFFRSR